jgi:spermidine synthase
VLTVGFCSGGASWSPRATRRSSKWTHRDCAEVVNAAPHLREANHDLFEQPNYWCSSTRGRICGDRHHDIIATDCTDLRQRQREPTPRTFGLCRRRLRPQGLVVV